MAASGLTLLSPAEKSFIEDGVAQNFRGDGRQCGDTRGFNVEARVVSNTNGSARVRVEGTDVLVGVKLVTVEPDKDTPESGKVLFMVDCSAGASASFVNRGGDQLANALTSALRRMADTPGALNLGSLCIIPGKRVWQLHVDALILECAGGNLVDCCGLAVRAALGCTEVNKTEIVRDDTGEAVDFEVLEESAPLDVSNFPVLVSLFQIGKLHVVDASAEEEACARGHMLVAVNKAGSVCSVHKGGRGGVTPAVLVEMLRLAREKGVALVETLDNKLASLVGGSFTGVT